MDPLSILQGALSLLGRPGNAVRGALIDPDHMEGFGRGISGQQQYDGTELPGINGLSDSGPSLGPIHLSPRAIGGFAGSVLLDPLTYLGGPLGRAGEGLAGLARGADATGGLLDSGARLTPELRGIFQGGVTHDHFQLPELPQQGELDSALAEGRLPAYQRMSRADDERYNTMSPEELQAFHPGTAGEEMHQADAPEYDYSNLSRSGRAEFTGLRPGYGDFEGRTDTDLRLFGDPNRMSQDPQHLVENVIERLGFDPADNKGTELSAYDPQAAHTGSLTAQDAPEAAQPTPVGDQLTAQARDKLYTSKNQMDVLKERKRAMEGYLIQTGNAEEDPATKELIIHMKGSQEPVTYERGGQPDDIDPETVRNAITDIESQMAELTQSEGYRSPRQFQNWQAKRDVRNDPSLIDDQRYNDAANNAGNSDWMNANAYRQSLYAHNTDPTDADEIFTAPKFGVDLDSTIRNVYNAMSGWKNRAEVDSTRLAPRAVAQRSQDINESMKGYHKWWNSGASGIEDPNDPELIANQYSSRALEDGDYIPEDNTRTDSSGTMAAGKYPLNVMQGGKVTRSSGDDRITFPQLLAKAPTYEGMYQGKSYLNAARQPGAPSAGEIDKLQKADLLLRRDDIARQSAPDVVYPVRDTQAWADSVDARVENLGQTTLDDAGQDIPPELANLASMLGDRTGPEFNSRDIIAELAQQYQTTPAELIQALSRITKPQEMLTPAERAARATSRASDITYQPSLGGEVGAAGIPGAGQPLPPGVQDIVAYGPKNFEEWLNQRLAPKGRPGRPAF